MLRLPQAIGILLLLLPWYPAPATCQTPASHISVILTVVDENSLPVPGAQVSISQPGTSPLQLQTDYAGRCTYPLSSDTSYQMQVDKPGFYRTLQPHIDPHLAKIEAVLAHEQIVRQEVNVVASQTGIDPEQTSDKSVMNVPEIVNIPYPTSRDIRNLLPFNPGVVQDVSGQVHLAGSETYAALDLLDGFNIRSPVSGNLALRVSPDAVRSINVETTRYPVEFGKATGGVVAFFTGMGDNKFRFNATDFLPSFHQINGIRFDKFVPRVTFSGPIVRNRAWFFDGVEAEYDNIYIQELPAGANTNHLTRGSNLFKAQANLASDNILSGGLLFNDYHSPYDGISPLVPQQSTTKRDTIAWLPYLRDQHTFANGAVLDAGFGVVRIRDGYEPNGDLPFQLTPETALGSYFENQVAHSSREEFNAALYIPPHNWAGRHDLKTGIDLDHIGFDEDISRAPVNYLREDRTLLRQSVFPTQAPFTRHNFETGAYLQDRWLMKPGLLVEPGLRFDWDEIIRRPFFSPRIAVVYAPPGAESKTKISAGIGLYYEHTQLEYLTRALAGIRYDTYYAADGTTPISTPLETTFQATDSSLTATHALNWSLGIERKLPGEIYAAANFLEKRISNGFVYANQTDPGRSLRHLPAHQHPARSLRLHRSRSAPNLRQRIHSLRLLHPLLSANQRSARLHPDRLPARPPTKRPTPMGHTQPSHLMGMASCPAAEAQKELGLRLHHELANRIPLHLRRRESPGGRCRRLQPFPRLLLLQPRPRMALPSSRRLLRPARRHGKRHRPPQSSHSEQHRRFTSLRNLQRRSQAAHSPRASASSAQNKTRRRHPRSKTIVRK